LSLCRRFNSNIYSVYRGLMLDTRSEIPATVLCPSIRIPHQIYRRMTLKRIMIRTPVGGGGAQTKQVPFHMVICKCGGFDSHTHTHTHKRGRARISAMAVISAAERVVRYAGMMMIMTVSRGITKLWENRQQQQIGAEYLFYAPAIKVTELHRPKCACEPILGGVYLTR
jgi:hypothetical protein